MSDPNELSKPYSTRDEAAVAGFRRVLLSSLEWESKKSYYSSNSMHCEPPRRQIILWQV